MTAAQVISAIRRRYNSESSTFWTDAELRDVLYEGEQELALECHVIEATDTSIATVAGTRAYAYPTNVQEIKRIEYNGQKLSPIDFRDDDTLTLSNSSTTAQGTPTYYMLWNDQIYLRPIPDAAQTLTLYVRKEATLPTSSTTALSTPARCHTSLIDYGAAQMAAKDQNWAMHDRFMKKWDEAKGRHRTWAKKRRRADQFAVVKTEENMANTFLGAV